MGGRLRCTPWVAVLACLAAGLVLLTSAPGAAAQNDVDPALFASLKWRSIGPDLGGRSIAVAGSVARPNEYYMGVTGGGLWKTTDGGTSWSPVTDGKVTSSSVGAVEVCPTNPDIVYIGMGEVAFRGNVIPGDGVYKSTDGGATWKHMGLQDAHMIGRVRVDPTNCNRVYVAALGHAFGPNPQRGVFRSTDGGATWQRMLYRDDITGAVDLSIDPDNPQVIFASLWNAYRKPWLLWSGGETSGLFKSTNGGATWTEITRNPGLPEGLVGKIGVSVSGADSNRVYAIFESLEGGVFRSDDGGASWQLVADDAPLRQRPFYYTRIYADPVDRDRVYVTNVDFWRSDDGGATYDEIDTPHGDNHDLWIAPDDNQRMIEGNDGGANVSTDGGDDWTDQDYPTAQMYHVITTNHEPYNVCGAQQERNTICVSSTGGSGSYGVGGGESGYIAVDPRDTNVYYAGSYGGNLSRLDRNRPGSRRIDVWPDNPMGHPALNLKHRFQWTFPIMTSPAEPNALFVGSQYVMKSTNNGQSWQQISPDLSYADPATLGDSGGPITRDQTSVEYYALVFAIEPSTLDPDIIWAGTDDGRVHLTIQGGGRWSNVTPDIPKFTRVAIIDAGQHDTRTAYVAAHRYRMDDFRPFIFRTHNGGRSWTKITEGIRRDDFVWVVREDPVRPGLLYAGTHHGVYVSFNDGARWHWLRNNIPDTPVSDLVIKGDDVVISTHGRSFYILDDGAALLRRLRPDTKPADVADFRQQPPTPTPLVPVNPPPPMIPPTTTAPDAENAVAILRDPNNPVRGVNNLSVSYTLKQAATSATAALLDANQQVVQTINLPATAGTRTFNWNLRHAGSTTFLGLIYWSANSQGPLAQLGTHSVRLTVDGQSLTQQFEIVKDPRIADIVSDADLDEQFDLARRIVDRTSDANDGVIAIRACTSQVDDRIAAANDPAVTQAGTTLRNALSTVENELYQTRLRSGQDPLNYPIKLNNKMAALRGIVESVQNQPTDQSHEVFADLSAKIGVQLDRLEAIVSGDVPSFNALLQQRGLQPIACAA